MKRKAKRSPKKGAQRRATKGGTIAAVAMDAILDGQGTAGVLKAVKVAFPRAHTTPACVGWYRAELRRRGKKVPQATQAKKEARP